MQDSYGQNEKVDKRSSKRNQKFYRDRFITDKELQKNRNKELSSDSLSYVSGGVDDILVIYGEEKKE